MEKQINGTVVSVRRVTPFHKYLLKNGKVYVGYSYTIKVKYSVDGKDYFKKRYLGYCDSESIPLIGSTLPVIYSENNPKKVRVRIPSDLNIQIPSIVFTFIFLAFALVFIGFLAVMINYHQMSKISYDDLSYEEFTVEEVNRKDTFFGDSYNIVVSETDKTIRIDNLFSMPYLEERYLSLEKGDVIHCYLIEKESYYDIVEIKSDEIILSLEEYKEIYANNSTFGLVFCPIVIIACIAFSIKSLVEYLRKQKQE
jgi:hypothetical protein